MSKSVIDVRRVLVNAGAHPIVNGVAAVISVLAGSLASFFTGSIRASLGLPKDPSLGSVFDPKNFDMTAEAGFFWTFVGAAAFLFAWSKFSDSATDNEHKGYVSKALHGLESMPPDAFLRKLADEYVTAHSETARVQASHHSSRGTLTAAAINESIQKVLKSVARVVQAYDGHVEREYRISLLLFSRDAWDKEKLGRVVDVATITQEAQLGSVESYRALTITHAVGKKSGGSFANSAEFAFPVHRERSEGDRANVLPGPPQACVMKHMYECHSVDELLNDGSAFDDKNQLKKYRELFTTGPGKGVKSFVSLVVPANQWNATVGMAGSEIAGVVHIEANELNVMKSASGFFWPVAQPFLLMISDLLALQSSVTARSKQESRIEAAVGP
jgi:hypothetical protein